MKWFIVVLLFSMQTALAQQLTNREFKYLDNKKELGAGLAYSLAFPGGGHFYAGAPDMGMVFGAAEIGFTVLYFIERRGNEGRTGAWVALSLAGLAKILDILSMPSSVSSYNERLAGRMEVTLSARGIGVQITI